MKPFKSAVLFLFILQAAAYLEVRQTTPKPSPSPSPSPQTSPTPTPTPTPTPGPPTTGGTTDKPSPTSDPTTLPTSDTTSNGTSDKTDKTDKTTGTPPPDNSPTPVVVVTNISNVDVTITKTNTGSQTSTPLPSNTSKSNSKDDGEGMGTGSIIGLSVAGGVALIGIIAFFVWKFTRKRSSDFDDNEAIKWPDLNNHGEGASTSHALPVKNTGRSGFDTGSEGSLSRVPSNNYSTDFGPSGVAPDPYAVPPLPHLNPNQPYRDDPGAVGAYYDPYRGPVPGTLEHGQEWGNDVIPMTQMGGGRMSPGPQAAYGVGGPVEYDVGPHAAYGGRSSPGPQAAYGGRMSPGPHAAYGGAVSPAPPAGGYDAYGGR